MKIIKSIDHKRVQSSFYEKLILYLSIFQPLLKKKLFNFYTNIVGTIPLKNGFVIFISRFQDRKIQVYSKTQNTILTLTIHPT